MTVVSLPLNLGSSSLFISRMAKLSSSHRTMVRSLVFNLVSSQVINLEVTLDALGSTLAIRMRSTEMVVMAIKVPHKGIILVISSKDIIMDNRRVIILAITATRMVNILASRMGVIMGSRSACRSTDNITGLPHLRTSNNIPRQGGTHLLTSNNMCRQGLPHLRTSNNMCRRDLSTSSRLRTSNNMCRRTGRLSAHRMGLLVWIHSKRQRIIKVARKDKDGKDQEAEGGARRGHMRQVPLNINNGVVARLASLSPSRILEASARNSLVCGRTTSLACNRSIILACGRSIARNRCNRFNQARCLGSPTRCMAGQQCRRKCL